MVTLQTAAHPMTVQLSELLHQYQLGLVLIAGTGDGVLERTLRWVHASELENPTPFLPPHTVLLTTGARFASLRNQEQADAYVQRLIDAETTALGFAVGLHWERVPARLVAACDRLGLPLFRVPYDTPFITIVQFVADFLTKQVRDRDLWALASQRSVISASLRSDGLSAAVHEAAACLQSWVAITDRSGRITEFAPTAARDGIDTEHLGAEVRNLLERGVSAGRIQDENGRGIRLQTLGSREHLLGVLVVQDRGAPDTAERSLIGLLAALATAQLERQDSTDDTLASVRDVIVELLMAQQAPLAERIATTTTVRIPRDSIMVVRCLQQEHSDPAFSADLAQLAAGAPDLIQATYDRTPIIVSSSRHATALRRLLLTHRITSGVSERGGLRELASLLAQADRALEYARTSAADAPIDYLPALHDGMLHLLAEHPEAGKRAVALLAPIRQHDRRHGDEIERSLRTWLMHHGHTSAAAQDLGVHRHTVKSRVQTAAELLQVDLDSPDTRAELWAALRLTDPDR